MKEKFRVVAVDETENWDADLLAQYHIEVAFTLYAIREGEATHCCSMQADSWAIALENVFLFDFDLDPSLRAAVIDKHPELCGDAVFIVDPLEQIRDKPGNDGLTHEALEDCYLSYVDPDKYPRRYISDSQVFTIRAGDYKGGSKGEEYHEAVWDMAREDFQSNGTPNIPILTEREYLAEMAETAARRRAENLPILPLSYRAEDHLPLFDAAAHRMLESELVNLRWFGPWAIGHYQRHPDELAQADMIRAGQIAGYLPR
jgi:hypothetical protein